LESSFRVIRRFALLVLLAACGGSSAGSAAGTPEANVTAFAAASLQPAFDKIGARLLETNKVKTTFSYAGTQTLTSQLTQGAQADVFAAADTSHMTALETAGLLSAPAKIFAHNWLEIVVAKGNPKGINGLADLARAGLVVVLADPSVPAGKYAQQALTKAHVTVHAASLELQVTGVLTKVQLGEADAGIVYASDIFTSTRVDGVPIAVDQNVLADYPIAALKSSAHPEGARAFIDFVLSPEGQGILKAAGFQGV
jgi:molybdate transport system substrate-binding protein